MTEQAFAENTSLAVEDVANPQTVSFTPDPPKEVKEAPKPVSAREAIEKSLSEIEAKDGKRIADDPRNAKPKKAEVKSEPAPKVEDKAVVDEPVKENPQSPQPENVNGEPEDKPLDPPKPPEGERDINRAPDNFLPRAREKWAEAPEEVRGEFYRALDNFEKGKQEYQEDREFRKAIRPFEDMAKQAGVNFNDAVKNYVEIDQMVTANPVEGVRRILHAQNIDLVQFAQHVLGQAQQEQANPALAHTRRLEQQVQTLTQQQQALVQQQQQAWQEAQQQQDIRSVEQDIIAPFKENHDRYDELQEDIVFFLNSGKIPSNISAQQRLAEAYYMAEQLNPASKSKNAQRPINPAGEKSIKGSLTGGLDIAPSKGAKLNSRDAVAAAMDSMGL